MATPTTSESEIRSALIASIEFQIGQTIPLLPKAFTRVLASALSGPLALLYRYGSFIFLQMFIATASNKAQRINGVTITPLQQWGLTFRAGLPVPATAAAFEVEFPVATITGATIDAGAQLVSATNGVTYLSTAAVLVNASTITVPVQAAGDQSNNAGLGAVGNLDPGSVVSFVTTPSGVATDGSVSLVTTTGADAESTDDYRTRVQDRAQKPPQGGALVDFELWGEFAAGITDVYPYAGVCPGVVDLYCQATEASSGSPEGIPTPAQLTAVKGAVNLDDGGRASRRPVNAFVKTLPISRKSFRVAVSGLVAGDSVSVQTQITDALAALFASFEPWIGGVSIIRRDRVSSAAVGGLVNDIVSAAGGTFVSAALQSTQVTSGQFIGKVVAGADDAEETAGVVTVGGLALELGGAAHYVGLRIADVAVPAGATITGASLALTASALNNTYSALTITGEASATPAAYTAAANDISDRDRTVGEASWSPAGWAAASVNSTPDLSAAVAEIVALAGWATGNAMAFVITGTDDSSRDISAFESGLVDSPELTINYTVESASYSTIQIYTLGRGEKATLDSVSFV